MKHWNLVAIAICLLAGVAALRPLSAEAQVVPTDTPLRVRWTMNQELVFCVHTSPLPADVSASLFMDWTQQAIDAWNAVDADVSLRISGTCTGTFAPGNGQSEVSFEVFEESDPFDGYMQPVGPATQPTETDVAIRVNTWWADSDLQEVCTVGTLVHEFGHAIGLSHSEFVTDVMGYGPCSVLRPSESEVEILAAAYGPRPAPLDVMTEAPDGSTTLSLGGEQTDYSVPGSYYFNPRVASSGGGALLLRAPACFTSNAPSVQDCAEEPNAGGGYWPVEMRMSPSPEIDVEIGESVIATASSLDHWAGPLVACNTVGCGPEIDVRLGDARSAGTGVDWGYLVFPLPDGRIRVQFVNLSFYLPPDFLDVAATFEVRRAGVEGTAGRLGTCSARLGVTCTVTGDFAGLRLELVHFDSSLDSRVGVSLTAPEAMEQPEPEPEDDGETPPPGGSPVLGGLPGSGVGLVIWAGGPVTRAAAEPRIGAVFVSSGGVLRGYIVGAPGFVNAGFLASVGETIPANTPVIIVVR